MACFVSMKLLVTEGKIYVRMCRLTRTFVWIRVNARVG